MHFRRLCMWVWLCALLLAMPAWAGTLVVESTARKPVPLGGTVWFSGKLDGVSVYLNYAVNGVPGGNATVGTINSQNGTYKAPAVMPSSATITVTGTTATTSKQSASTTITLASGASATASISSVTPLTPSCGPNTFTVTGSYFVSGAVVRANGAALPTAYVSPTRLTALGTITQNGPVSFEVISAGDVRSNTYTQVQVVGCGTQTSVTTSPLTTTPVVAPSLTDAATIAAARFLEQASFGPAPADLALVKQIGPAAWITQQMALPASPVPAGSDLNALRRNWYMNMAAGQDQLRQRVIFALSQIFVVSANKNPYANEIQPWLRTLSDNAFGNFGVLLREMSLNPAMGKYLDMGNSVLPEPNENYAREVMQLFTVGPVLLNPDGSPQLDGSGNPLPTYNQARISDFAGALSGWTYPGNSATGLNWENFSGPLQPRDNYHDKRAKTLLSGVTLRANQSARQDFDGVMQNLFQHPNVPPFIATRLIRHLTTSNPSPAYIQRVAAVFANGGNGRGDLAATVRAVLLDPEARQDNPGATQGRLKDPMLHSLGLVRALSGTVINPSNLFWNYSLLGEQIISPPSVFSFFSPMTRLPEDAQLYGPEFQIYAPSLAVARANFLYDFIAGNFNSMIRVDIAPFVNAAANPENLINLVDATLMQGRMRPSTRQAIATALNASTDNRQRAITALYLTAVTAEFAVHK